MAPVFMIAIIEVLSIFIWPPALLLKTDSLLIPYVLNPVKLPIVIIPLFSTVPIFQIASEAVVFIVKLPAAAMVSRAPLCTCIEKASAVEVLITGSFVTLGITTSLVAVGMPALQLPSVSQSELTVPVQVVWACKTPAAPNTKNVREIKKRKIKFIRN